MVLSGSSNFFGIEVEGWLDQVVVGPDSGMVSKTFPFIFLACEDLFFLEGTSRR